MAWKDIIQSLITTLGVFLVATDGSKIIKTRFGDVYDCVDFHEQPTLKYLQVQNHEYHHEMRPSFIPKRASTSDIAASNVKCETAQIHQLENGGCPSGTVPIRRVSKEDYARASKSSQNLKDSKSLSSNMVQPRPGTHLAILQTKSSASPPTYYGVGANISLWNPQVQENQYSAIQVTISSGTESLQTGWMVYPAMKGNNQTRLFIHTTVGESHCYDTHCPGFVQVHPKIPVDSVIHWPPRHTGHPQPFFNVLIYRDPPSGHWWLIVTDHTKAIGFWPNNIFKDMSKSGTYVSCGGETYSPPDQPGGLPPMGNGAFPLGSPTLDAYAKEFSIVNDKNLLNDAQDVETFMSTERKYYIRDLGLRGYYWGHVLDFGGFGG